MSGEQILFHFFSYSHKIFRFFDSNTIPASCMTSQIMTGFFFLIIFFAWFSRLIASFVGASVIDHDIKVGNIAC